MIERPYTDDDLRIEAARQHHTASSDHDFMGIGEQMDGSPIESTCFDAAGERHEPGLTWNQLDRGLFVEAQRAIDDLLVNAADVSEWAVNLGADGLQPSNDHILTLNAGERPIVRIHFAFEPDMDEDMRTALVQGLGDAIDSALPGTH